MITLKLVRQRLTGWGYFWANQEVGQGFASQSVTSRCCEIMRTGIQSDGTTHMFSNSADAIYIPFVFEETGKCVSKLTANEQHYVKLRYIKMKQVDNLFIDRAHASLISLME